MKIFFYIFSLVRAATSKESTLHLWKSPGRAWNINLSEERACGYKNVKLLELQPLWKMENWSLLGLIKKLNQSRESL